MPTRTEFLSAYIRLLIVELLRVYGVEFDFLELGPNNYDFVWEEVPTIRLEDGKEIDISDLARKTKEKYTDVVVFTRCIERDLFKVIYEKTELFLNPTFCIEWLTELIESEQMKSCKINGPSFCDLFFETVLPKFVIKHISSTGDDFLVMYENYNLEILSLIKVVMKQVSHSFHMDDLPENSPTQKLYERFGRNCRQNIYSIWNGILRSLYSSMFIQLVDGTLKLEDIPENLISDLKYYILYQDKSLGDLPVICQNWYLEDSHKKNIMSLDFLKDLLDDTFELNSVFLRLVLPIISTSTRISLSTDLFNAFLREFSDFLQGEGSIELETKRPIYIEGMDTLEKTITNIFMNIVDNINENCVEDYRAGKTEEHLYLFTEVFELMYSSGHSSIPVLQCLKYISELPFKIDTSICFAFGEDLLGDAGEISWKELPEYFQLCMDYHALLQRLITYKDILEEAHIVSLEKCIGFDLDVDKLEQIALCFIRLNVGLYNRETYMFIRSMLEYDMTNEEIVDEIEDEIEQYVCLEVNAIGMIVCLFKTFYKTKLFC